MADGVTLDAGAGDISITLSTGAGLTNTASGDITLANLSAANVLVKNDGPTDGAGIKRTATSNITADTLALDVANAANATGDNRDRCGTSQH